jgi:hypothetical protein
MGENPYAEVHIVVLAPSFNVIGLLAKKPRSAVFGI